MRFPLTADYAASTSRKHQVVTVDIIVFNLHEKNHRSFVAVPVRIMVVGKMRGNVIPQADRGSSCGCRIANEFLIIVSQAARSAPPFVDTLIPERQFTR